MFTKLCAVRANRSKKGFTLAELLIVVAIVGVLLAIAFPVFTSQLNKARAATDAANLRSALAVIRYEQSLNSEITDEKLEDACATAGIPKEGYNGLFDIDPTTKEPKFGTKTLEDLKEAAGFIS